MIKRDIQKLRSLIAKVYKRHLNLSSNKQVLNLPVSPAEHHSELVADFSTGKDMIQDSELLQALLDDMCLSGIIKEGDYVIYLNE